MASVRKGWSGEVQGSWLKLSVEVSTDDYPEANRLNAKDRITYLGFQATRALTILQAQNGVLDPKQADNYDEALCIAAGALVGPFDD